MSIAKELPTPAEWQAIFNSPPLAELLVLARGPSKPAATLAGIDGLAQSVTLSRLGIDVHNRILDVARAFGFMTFYYRQGIPDQRWHISPGRHGQSVEYFPDFEEHHFVAKEWFDFYSDTFYQKLFSAWSILGHLLNIQHALGLKERDVDFTPAVRRLASVEPELATTLQSVVTHQSFTDAQRLRHDITHNEAPTSIGMTVTRHESEKGVVYTMGTRAYTTSAVFAENAEATIALLKATLQALRDGAT